MGAYGDVFAALRDAQVSYVVVGGTAVVLQGHARLTVDLDLVIDLARASVRQGLEASAGRGTFETSKALNTVGGRRTGSNRLLLGQDLFAQDVAVTAVPGVLLDQVQIDPAQVERSAAVAGGEVGQFVPLGNRITTGARCAVVGQHRLDGVVVGQHPALGRVLRQTELGPRALLQRRVEPDPLDERGCA